RSIATGAMAYAAAHKPFLAGHAQTFEPGPGGDYDGFGEVLFHIGDDRPKALLCVETLSLGALKRRTLIGGLPPHRWRKVVASDAIGEAGEVLDFFDTDQMPAGNVRFEDQGG